MKVLITGAAGTVGRALIARVATRYELRLIDRIDVPDPPADAEARVGDVNDPRFLADAVSGVDAVVHLAANPSPVATWAELEAPNLVGVRSVLETAASRKIRRVVVASSCHAAGRYDVERRTGVDPRWPARPCCRYGVTKAFGESLAGYLADVEGLSTISLRLGAVSEVPLGQTGLAFWLSFDDLARAMTAAIETDTQVGVYYAGSRNVRERWDLDLGAAEIGYLPVDDAADFSDQIGPEICGPACYDGAF